MEPDKEGGIERCIRQVFRPEIYTNVRPDGWGDCYHCKYDPVKNKQCAGYYPIKVATFDVYARK